MFEWFEKETDGVPGLEDEEGLSFKDEIVDIRRSHEDEDLPV